MTKREQRRLIDGYFTLRQQCPELKAVGHLFEAAAFQSDGEHMVRQSADSHQLRVYCIEGDIEACVIYPNGTSKTFTNPAASTQGR